MAATARVQPLSEAPPPGEPSSGLQTPRFRTSKQIIAIGASTGGTAAIRQVLSRLPQGAPAVVISQHIPRAFSAQFAAHLDACSPLHVREAEHGVLIQPGHVYIAPGDRHLTVARDGAHYRCEVSDAPAVNHHRPCVDLLFESMARSVGANGVGVLLTGMGADGARGLKQMRDQGACTIAQDERTSVVWGMPGAAVALGGVQRIVALEDIAAVLAGGGNALPRQAVAGR
jgi:two-component system, chemotaxis family, protein-glutamate methylesterase/glutaminase